MVLLKDRLQNIDRQGYTDLSNLLVKTGNLHCTNVSDKVFAILGIYYRVRNTRAATLLPQSLLEPDYSKSAANVLRDATRFAIMESQRFFLLQYPPNRWADIPSLPSWVPSWFGENAPGHESNPLALEFDSGRGLPSLSSNAALISGRSGELPLEGISVDAIEESTAVMTREHLNHLHTLSALLEQISTLVSKMESPLADPRGSSALGETLIAGEDLRYEPSSSEDVVRGWTAFSDYIMNQRVYPPPWRAVREADEHTRRASDYHFQMYNACRDRQFFSTQNGYIGLGPSDLQQGDLVTVLQGGRWPFILRPEGEWYTMLGAAYVRPIMYGEAVAEAAKVGQPVVTFNIR
ncbi:hypothetical protein LTR85_009417 [Meristemomyces frigidus]|nr:hypothetical protein LTR85_009417 [Meristemomyces frigidus]